ncbi:MAG: hypothetical protein CVU05_12595 [Bacteroidetes bacterium HGW-Bacteroidetes-21]|jgi:PKD repeat protein|nr:MAG: hypothetical protein CVU05_12595 [Bacteroidetes bacterium HGW-Bacteroidetes-21]
MKKTGIIIIGSLFVALLFWVGCKKETNNDESTLPVANFSASATSVAIGHTVTFSDLSTENPSSWSWSFTGGTPATSTVQNPVVTYNTAGTYAVSLTATNSNGSNTVTKAAYITVTNSTSGLVANFSADNTLVVCYQNVNFSDLSTGSPVSWSWTFNNGTPATSTQQNPVVKWTSQGNFTVSLTVTDAGGASNTVTKNLYIAAAANLLFWKNFSGPNVKVYACVIPGTPYNASSPNTNLKGTITSFSATAPNCGATSGWVSSIASGFINYYCLEETTGRHWTGTNYAVPIGVCGNVGLTDTNVDP